MDASPYFAKRFRILFLGCLMLGFLPSLGCRICADCEDLAYPAYGGAWERTRREDGRVGSLFDPAGARNAQLVDRDTPLDPDELERAKRKNDPEEGIDGEDPSLDEADSDSSQDSDPDGDEGESLRKEKQQQLRDLDLDDIRASSREPQANLTMNAPEW
ncbi:hypothetical protein [Novipirellula artificiosorum]|uniref:Uncharacterized protein n=1 Tax=Novipirellula artificiosorum TaxID=2528016 RepID=A0A5C6DWT9_9BACT|nr:hypothetical protein [Novipirellula artificiosorum]TWU40674.1 hypothetical protein Poly41_15090 [Novipirellula artificiosorum]